MNYNNIKAIKKTIPPSNYKRCSSIPLKTRDGSCQKYLNNASSLISNNSSIKKRPISKSIREINEERIDKMNELEKEIFTMENENVKLTKYINDNQVLLEKLTLKSEKLALQVKGLRDRIFKIQKQKANLIHKHANINKDIQLTHKEINAHRRIKDYKVFLRNSKIEHENMLHEDRKNNFLKKYEKELQIKNDLEKSLKEVQNKINEYKIHFNRVDHKRQKSCDAIIRQRAEMQNFLLEI